MIFDIKKFEIIYFSQKYLFKNLIINILSVLLSTLGIKICTIFLITKHRDIE